LFKSEVIHHRGPWSDLDQVEYATLAWGDWFNNRRLLEPIGDIPPAEFELMYYPQQDESAAAAWLNENLLRESRCDSREGCCSHRL